MTTVVRSGLSVLLLVTLCTVGLMVASVDISVSTAEASAHTVPMAVSTTKPHPKVVAKNNRRGTTLAGKQQQERKEKKQGRGKPSIPPAPKPTPRRAIPPAKTKQLPFRLNVGVCGQMGPEGNTPGPLRCEAELVEPDPTRPTVPPEVVQPPRPQDVSWEQVLAESKDVAFPSLRVKVQPAGRTLVNLDTIVYTDESGISTDTVALLGFPVEVEATPISYSWNFGDGSPVLTTTMPGKPHPAKEITHKYLKRASVNLTLTTNYAARFNVAGTGWQYVNGTVPITGPATPLLVREAVPVLVDPPN